MAPLLAAAALLGCPATTVHYSTQVPWVKSGAVVGSVFEYGGRTLMDERVNSSDGLVLYTHRHTLDGDTKVLWTIRKNFGPTLTLRATRLDAPGSFTQQFSHRGGQFPSIVDVPAAGCWRLSLRTGKVRASFVVIAVDAPAEAVCEPTRVYLDGVARMLTTPTANGIEARRFVSIVPGAERAVVYAGGVKFLWLTPHPGPQVTLAGTRLDRPGTFRDSFFGATTDTELVWPSTLNIPSSGCWAVRVSIGGRTGLAVFEAVVT